MNSLFDLVFSQKGIQDFFILYDTIFINSKVDTGSQYINYMLIDKMEYSYDNTTFEKINKGIIINFGDTGTYVPNKTTGNGYVGKIFNNDTKQVFLVALSSFENSIYPVIYTIDINTNNLKIEFFVEL